MDKSEDGNLTNDEEMKAEYKFDYSKAKPNRFVVKDDEQVVVLDADVAEFFKDSETVNRVLRALIETMPRAA